MTKSWDRPLGRSNCAANRCGPERPKDWIAKGDSLKTPAPGYAQTGESNCISSSPASRKNRDRNFTQQVQSFVTIGSGKQKKSWGSKALAVDLLVPNVQTVGPARRLGRPAGPCLPPACDGKLVLRRRRASGKPSGIIIYRYAGAFGRSCSWVRKGYSRCQT